MKTFTDTAAHYQARFGYSQNFEWADPSAQLRVCVVIPAFNEVLEATFKSLEQNVVDAEKIEVILVLNHSEKEKEEVKKIHVKQARHWDQLILKNGLKVHVAKAFDLPAKQAGVGLARKIGMDIALSRFAQVCHDGLIVCLDADCTVSVNYLTELLKAEKETVNGLSVHFEHLFKSDENYQVKERIIAYELWLRYYIQALRFTGYSHAFHTIGSSMAARASAYAKIGGMNRRKAGEDFYFLHKLIPHGNFYDLTSCTVFPSARSSERVPFGTGRAMLQMASGDKDFNQVYHPEIFQELKSWLDFKEEIFSLEVGAWPAFIREVFEGQEWIAELKAIKQRSTKPETLIRNFHFWLDGFKMLKMVHHARDCHLPNQPVLEASKRLLNLKAANSEQLLMEYRKLEVNSPFFIFTP